MVFDDAAHARFSSLSGGSVFSQGDQLLTTLGQCLELHVYRRTLLIEQLPYVLAGLLAYRVSPMALALPMNSSHSRPASSSSRYPASARWGSGSRPISS